MMIGSVCCVERNVRVKYMCSGSVPYMETLSQEN